MLQKMMFSPKFVLGIFSCLAISLSAPPRANAVEPAPLAPETLFPGAGRQPLAFKFSLLDSPNGKPSDTPAESVTLEGGNLSVAAQDCRVDFEVVPRGSYVVLRIKNVTEPFPGKVRGLSSQASHGTNVVATPLDYMTETTQLGGLVSWPWIAHREDGLPMGAAAYQRPAHDTEFDENLLRIWVQEGLPHPAVEGEWTLQRAREWMADWQARFTDQSTLVVTAENPADLERMTEWAEKIGMKRIYLHTDSWRGEYWPRENSFMHVKTDAFPKGEEDLRAYGQRLREQGMELALHSTSISIGKNDPDYVSNGVHPELQRWARGTLEKDATPTDQTLFFKPGSPPHGQSWSEFLATVPEYFSTKTFLVGGELIDAGNIANMDGEVWELQQCRRGEGTTQAAEHKAGTPMEAMVMGYGRAFVPDTESPLFEETIERWADFCERNNVHHLECDALEIHRFKPWGGQKFSWMLASKLKEPVTSNTSSGGPLPWHIEYWFRGSAAVRKNHASGGAAGGAGLPLQIEAPTRPSTGPYEILTKPQQMIAAGGQSFTVSKPVKMFGVTVDALQKSGIPAEIETLLSNWRAIVPDLTPAQREAIRQESSKYLNPLDIPNNHPGWKVLFRPEVNGDQRRIVPLRMVHTAIGETKWGYGQERGPLVPRLTLPSNGSVELVNPWNAQEPEFIIRILGTPTEMDSPAASTQTTPEAAAHPIDLMPTEGDLTVDGQPTPYDPAQGLTITASNDTDRPLYTLPGKHATWPLSRDLAGASGIVCDVEGDGSGALLVITMGGNRERDFTIPIDFTGQRQVWIPTGDVSTSDPRWGFRLATSLGNDWATLRAVKATLGMLPPGTSAKVKIRAIRPLALAPSETRDLALRLAPAGELLVPGPVPSGSYLWYRGGNTIGLYDANWNKLSDLPLKKDNFLFPEGPFQLEISTAEPAPQTWLECQFFVKDQPMEIVAKQD